MHERLTDSQAAVLKAMLAAPCTVDDLVESSGNGISTVRVAIRALRDGGLCIIGGSRQDADSGGVKALYLVPREFSDRATSMLALHQRDGGSGRTALDRVDRERMSRDRIRHERRERRNKLFRELRERLKRTEAECRLLTDAIGELERLDANAD